MEGTANQWGHLDQVMLLFAFFKPNIRTISEYQNLTKNSIWLLFFMHSEKDTLKQMSLAVRKPVFVVSNQVPHKPGCTAIEDG